MKRIVALTVILMIASLACAYSGGGMARETGTPVPATITPSPTPLSYHYCLMVTATALNMRELPTEKSYTLHQFRQGDIMTGYELTGNWWHVSKKGQHGYVNSTYVKRCP